MDHKKLLEMQRELDNEIRKNHNIEEMDKNDILRKKTLALLVEFSEFTNSLSDFKYWKKNKNIDVDHVYEEFADILHFIYSFYLLTPEEFNNSQIVIEDCGDPIAASLEWFKISETIINWNNDSKSEVINIDNLNKSFGLLLSIANKYEMNIDRIEESYIKKNKVNFQRLLNNY